MKDGQPDNSPDELEIVQVLRVNAGMGIDLQSVIIVGGIFKETVERIEHFVRKKEEEFTIFTNSQ